MSNYDIGTLDSNVVSKNGFHLSSNHPTDVFEFDISGTRTINLSLTNITAGDDADLNLYRDSNNNGIFDSSDLRVASSSHFDNNDELINYRASSGTYFAQVERYDFGSSGSVHYDLDMSATSSNMGNLVNAEYQVGDLSGDVLRRGYVGSDDTADTYAFSLDFYEGTNISLSGLSSDADIRLIRDSNNNGIVDANEVIESSTGLGSRSESITGIDTSGDYFVQVYQYSGNTNYTLSFDHYTTSFA